MQGGGDEGEGDKVEGDSDKGGGEWRDNEGDASDGRVSGLVNENLTDPANQPTEEIFDEPAMDLIFVHHTRDAQANFQDPAFGELDPAFGRPDRPQGSENMEKKSPSCCFIQSLITVSPWTIQEWTEETRSAGPRQSGSTSLRPNRPEFANLVPTTTVA